MLCEKCQKNNATVHVQKFANGEKVEYHLCEDCAAGSEMQISFDNLFQGFLNSLFNTVNEKGYSGRASSGEILKCPNCNLTYDGFKRSGKLGCESCYGVFRKQLEAVLRDIHGSTEHHGKFPQKMGAELRVKRDIEKLRINLAKVLEKEEYEEAAKIRDKIKELSANRFEREEGI